MMKVLILDNDKWVVEGLRKLVELVDSSLERVVFTSSVDALEYARKEKPMLVIADVEMPEMNGLEFCRRLCQHYHPHMIIISGYDKFHYAQEAISIGVSRYVLKPVKQPEFVELLKQELANIEREKLEQRILKQSALFAELNLETAGIEPIVGSADSVQYITDKMLAQDCGNVSLDTVANACNIHRNYLSILFKEKVGVNFKDYVLQYKMRKAKQLLCSSNIKMGKIAEELGYMDVKNFSRAFKSYTGQAPSEYRSQIRENREKEQDETGIFLNS